MEILEIEEDKDIEEQEETYVKRLDDVEDIGELPTIDLSEGGDFSLTLNINGVDVVDQCGTGSETVRKILDLIGYGTIGWEKYNIV